MKKNVASQAIGAQMVSATDGSAFTGSVTVYVTGDAGTQAVGSVGSGACTHEGNGFHTYAPAQAETNYDHVAFTFIGTGAIPQTVQVYTNFPQTVDNATNISAIKTKTDYLPSATAGSAGGVFIAGTNAATTVTTSFTTTFTGNLTGSVGSVTGNINTAAGTIQTLDALDTAQDTQHSTTQTAISTAQADLDTITGSDGVTLATAQALYAPAKAGDSMALTAGAVDLIWDEPIAGHLTAGTAGLSEALGSAALVDTTVTGTPTGTTIQLTVGSAIDNFYNDQLIYILSGTGIGQVRTISDYTGATKTVTIDEAWVTTPVASDRVAILVTHVHPKSQISAQIMADLDANGSTVIDELTTQGDTNEAAIAALNNLSAAQVNAEVVDVLKTDTISEMAQAAPPATPTFEEAVMYLYMALTKKIDVTATLKEFHNNAGTVIWKKTLSDDGTTYSEANGATGP